MTEMALTEKPCDVKPTRVDWRVWLILAWVGFVALTPITATRLLGGQLVALFFVIGLAGIQTGRLWARWRGILLTVCFLAFFVAIGHPLRAQMGWLPLVMGILIKNGTLFGTVAALSETVGQVEMLTQLGRLGLPAELISTISLMARYGPLLSDQGRRMKRARQSRMVRKSLPGVWLLQSGGLAMLLVRSLERSERLNAAMLSRGWQSGSKEFQANSDAS